MKAVLSVLSALALFIGCLPIFAQAQNVAGVNFRAVIPGSMELTENVHPTTTSGQSRQHLAIMTKVAGTCLQLKNRAADPSWSVDTNSPDWIYKRVADGYIFCTDMAGTQSLNLTHQFGTTGQRWPITVTLGAKP